MIPESILDCLTNNLDIAIHNTKTLSGGSINQSYKIESNNGDLFLKWNRSAPDDFFDKEARGLDILKESGSELRIPEVIAVRKPETGRPGFLLMEFIPEGDNGNSYAFGEQLAILHNSRGESFGLDHDNYIGSLPQSNKNHDNWVSFFSEERIGPQLKIAVDSGKMDSSSVRGWTGLQSRLDDLMPPVKPSLIHGDLWGGNYLFDQKGSAVLIDPAVYYGHPEMDLAFSKMFGGFSVEFYDGYESVSPTEAGFSERVPLYNLYPLLVHVNLFGGHYTSQAAAVLKNYQQ